MAYDETFEDITLERGDKRVVWEYIGEGASGYYDSDDPEDVPLLRFSCDKRVPDGEGGFMWEGLEDASYCTRMPIDSPLQMLVQGAGIIMEAIDTDASFKKRLEELSWFCPDDFKGKR